jgi:hypothetical protein
MFDSESINTAEGRCKNNFGGHPWAKSEILNPKSETNSKEENSNDLNSDAPGVLNISDLDFECISSLGLRFRCRTFFVYRPDDA